jgi:hypothetical protein
MPVVMLPKQNVEELSFDTKSPGEILVNYMYLREHEES